MQSNFNFYDLVGYIIPGAIVLAFFYWFAIAFIPLVKPLDSIGVGFGESLAFLGISYFIGHLIQIVGNHLEKRQHKSWGGWFSDQFLRPENSYFSDEFKNRLSNCIKKSFKLDPNPPQLSENDQRQRRSEVFRLCYALIIQKSAAGHTEIFNGIYGLYRGILSAAWIGVVITALITLKHLALIGLPKAQIRLPPGNSFEPSASHVWLGLMALALLFIAIPLLNKRLKRFSQHFAGSVYRNFYVWCCQQELFRR